MSGLGFYDEYLKLMGNLKDKPDLATPYKIKYLKNIIQNGKVYKFISFEENAEIKIGDIISHDTLGTGVVVNMNGDLIDVAFKTGVKKLMKNHKSITKL